MQADWSWLVPVIVLTGLLVGCAFFAYVGELYRFSPSWGPYRKFDSQGNEDLGLNQFLIHRHIEKQKEEEAAKARSEEANYGTLGPPTWGTIEAPWQHREKMWDPKLQKEVFVRRGFADTQYLRAHSSWWARDEPTYIQQAGLRAPPVHINDNAADWAVQRLGV
mmetsp:Transcript_17345/g.26168  ORF Transcript_17345/g.26168 Transcript_17345/m.26168 type:complete len:164 (+) Transcript_17345:125-616(+)